MTTLGHRWSRGYRGGMALLHEATISPRKDELIGPWLASRTWWDGVDDRGPVGTFRLDDPAGEVGIECFLFGSADGSTLFVPVTYRGAPLADAEPALIGVMEHSVLGTRYVYDACADPVFVATVLDTVRDGGREADQVVRRADGTEVARESGVSVRGDGVATVPRHDPAVSVRPTDGPDRTRISLPTGELTVMRRLGEPPQGAGLTGSFAGGDDLRLAIVTG